MIPAAYKEQIVNQINQQILETSARLQELTIIKMEMEKRKPPYLIRIK